MALAKSEICRNDVLGGVSRTALLRVGAHVAWAIGLVVLGAAAGLAGGLATPAHLQIAGTDASIRVEVGQSYDELEFTGLLAGRRATDRALLGEQVGVRVRLDLDTSTFLDFNGTFNARVLPAYIQTYSNPDQVAHDVQRAIAAHLLRWIAAGVAVAVLGVLGRRAYVTWRHRKDTQLASGPALRSAAIAYRAPERRLARRAVVVGVLVAAVGAAPSSAYSAAPPTPITPTPLLDGTPLAGAEVGGPLLPAFDAAEAYIRKYFADTNSYYAQVRTELLDELDASPPTLPTGTDVVHVGLVTDRHCNTGMDRVIVALLERLGVRVLVSAGDDAFSGTFAFESACTAGLASASRRAHIADVFVGGNHDSEMTLADEKDQGIEVLDGEPVTAGGLTFVGLPDPRSSRYGQGIRPSSSKLQTRLVSDQGARAASIACDSDGPAIVVLHDPRAGRKALEDGCGNAVLALDGHTHEQHGPDPVTLPDGSVGYMFTGASSGGAPTDKTIEHSFSSSLTVGPLNHDATINIVSVDGATGRLLGVTECRVRPDQSVTFVQQLIS